MNKNQSISCQVEHCEHHCGESCGCKLSQILVTTAPENEKAHYCESYKPKK